MTLTIFVSGGGTNCEALIKHFNTPDPAGRIATVGLVVSNRADAYALTRAQRLDVPTTVINRHQLADAAYMMNLLRQHHTDVIILAGFLAMVPDYIINAYLGRIINLHPALLPRHGGKGMYGHHVHEAVKAAGDTVTGMTVHHVSAVCDGGKIIAQRRCPVLPTDTPDDIAAREHELEMAHFPTIVEEYLTSLPRIREGYMPFMGHRTYYRIVGECRDGKKPLVLIHGGPGSTHNYFEVLDSIAQTGRAVISYDQIGCGNSYLDGHPELWTLQTWADELIALRQHLDLQQCHLLGQSWGGMLILAYLTDYTHSGICSAILSSTNPSASLWSQEQHRMIGYMSASEQEAIRQAEETGRFDDPAYLAANDHFMELHCAGPVTDASPDCLRRPKRTGSESYLYGWGPNEYVPTGSLANFEYLQRMGEIQEPTLVISGTDDLCTPLQAKAMYDGLHDGRWELFAGCRHMPFVEDTAHYCAVLTHWLDAHD